VSKQSHRALWFNRNLRLDLQARLAVSRAARALAVSHRPLIFRLAGGQRRRTAGARMLA